MEEQNWMWKSVFEYKTENIQNIINLWDNKEILSANNSGLEIIILIMILCFIGFYFILPYLWGYILLYKKDFDKIQKKKILNNLILAKDMQWEIDNEIKEAFSKWIESWK